MDKYRYANWTLILVLAVWIGSFFQQEPYRSGIVSGGDAWGYYAYLPAFFIHNDLDSLHRSVVATATYNANIYNDPSSEIGIAMANAVGEGRQVIRWTMGVAILQLPFFAVAHVISIISGFPADGYSFWYRFMAHLAALVYAGIGLLLLKKTLSKYFDQGLSAMVLAAIGLGTNLYYFSVFFGSMAHAYLFFLWSAVIRLSLLFYESRHIGKAILIGLCCGLITLIRPSEIIVVLIPLLFGIGENESFRERMRRIGREYRTFLLAALAAVIVGSPQLIYWKLQTGALFYDSYRSLGFHFDKPEILNGLFSYQNGWLAYTPIMYLGLFGVFFLFRSRMFLWAVLAVLPVHIYLTYSWYYWDYSNGFGSRPMIDIYPLLAIPMGYGLQYLSANKWVKRPVLALTGFFIWLNLFNTYQYNQGLLISGYANWPFYQSIFGKTSLSCNDLLAYDMAMRQPDMAQLTFTTTIGTLDFEAKGIDTSHLVRQPVRTGKYAYRLTPSEKYSPAISAVLHADGNYHGHWFRVCGWFWAPVKTGEILNMSKLVLSVEQGNEFLLWQKARINNKIGGNCESLDGGEAKTWGEVCYFVAVPEGITEKAQLKAYVWNNTDQDIFVDDLKVEVFSAP